VAANQLDQDFTAVGPDQKWAGDTLAPARSAGVTYVPTAEGWLYLSVVLDLYSRRIVGWAMSDSLQRQLVIDALQMAMLTRRPAPGLLHHSDRGSQYASHDYQALLTRAQMTVSMSRKGNCHDNAAVESFFGTFKTELVYQRQYATKPRPGRTSSNTSRCSTIAFVATWRWATKVLSGSRCCLWLLNLPLTSCPLNHG
jgi:putative transposase